VGGEKKANEKGRKGDGRKGDGRKGNWDREVTRPLKTWWLRPLGRKGKGKKGRKEGKVDIARGWA